MDVLYRSIMENKISLSTLVGVKTYIGRIKDPKDTANLHSKLDFLHAIIFDDPEEDFDYLDLRKVIEEDNGLILYTSLVDRTKKQSVTWAKCIDTLKNKPPVGRRCVVMHEHPLSFGGFAEFAYSKGILTNSEAFDKMKSRISPAKASDTALTLPPPTVPSCKRSTKDDSSITAVRKGIETAISMKKTIDSSDLPNMSAAGKQLALSSIDSSQVGSNVVLGDKEEEYGELSREYWKARALKAEDEALEFKEKLAVKEDELIELRNALKKASGLKEGFVANSDLAQVAVRETQALASKAIIDGLKPEFSTLPKISKSIETLNTNINALTKLPDMVKALENLPAMVETLVDLPALVTALKASIDASTEHSIEDEDARSSDSESILCSVKRANKLMASFGFSSENQAYNVPEVLSSILSHVRQPQPEFSSSTIRDTSRPPPPVPSASTAHGDYLLNTRNNNPAPGGLMPTPPSSGNFHQGYYPQPYSPAPSYAPPPGHGPGMAAGYGHDHGHSHGRRTPPLYGSGQHGHGHSPHYGPVHGPQTNQGGGLQGKRNYPFMDSQRNFKK